MTQGWTDDRVDRLKTLWTEGLSASQIAKQLGGGVTRNAIIGKVHRLGLSGRAEPSQPRRATPSAPRPRRPRPPRAIPARPAPDRRPSSIPPRPAATSAPDPALALPGTATAATLGARMCKWPIGDPASASFCFCGRSAPDHGPYCDDHERVAHPPRKAAPLEADPLVRRVLAGLAA